MMIHNRNLRFFNTFFFLHKYKKIINTFKSLLSSGKIPFFKPSTGSEKLLQVVKMSQECSRSLQTNFLNLKFHFKRSFVPKCLLLIYLQLCQVLTSIHSLSFPRFPETAFRSSSHKMRKKIKNWSGSLQKLLFFVVEITYGCIAAANEKHSHQSTSWKHTFINEFDRHFACSFLKPLFTTCHQFQAV